VARRITILGMGPSASHRRFDIERYVAGTEVWSLNNAYVVFDGLRARKGFHRMFELHAWNYLRTWKPGITTAGQEIDHWAELESLQCEVVTGQRVPVVTRQRQIDWDAVFRHFGLPVYFLGSPWSCS